MKLWIINILRYIINSIESEEDDTLHEDDFKNIVIKLEQLSKYQKEEMQKVWRLYQINSSLKISNCKNCPIYCQTFSPD